MTRIEVDSGKYTVVHENGADLHALRHGEPWRDLCGDGFVLAMAQEIEALREKCGRLADSLDAVERMRPHWAQGYSSDSLAAQAKAGALSQLWALLDTNDQTQAVMKLSSLKNDLARQRELRSDTARLVEALEKYESAFEELFAQCCSNPVTNAWGQPVSMAALSDAHAFASSRLAAHRKQGGGV